MTQSNLNRHETDAHLWFARHAPELESRLKAVFGHLNSDAREGAVADARAGVYASCLSAAKRGTLQRITPFTAAHYAGIGHRVGRRFTGTCVTDVMGEAAQATGRVRVGSYDRARVPDHAEGLETVSLAEALADHRRWDAPPENARRNGDYPAILEAEAVTEKARRTFRMLAESQGSARNIDIAAALGVSQGRATQLKTILAQALARHGYRHPSARSLREPTRRAAVARQ